MVRAIQTLVTVAMLFPLAAGTAAATDTSLPLTPNSADIEWRFVLEKSSGAGVCPDAGVKWKSRQLVATSFMDTQMHKGLTRYCVYEHAGGSLLPADIAALNASVAGLGTLANDRIVMGAAGDGLEDAVWPALATSFEHQAGLVNLPLSTTDHPTRLTILDTSPTQTTGAYTAESNSPHGYTLLNMAERLLCDGSGDCPIQVTSQLALPWVRFDLANQALSARDDEKGGYVGSMLDLAEAIRVSVFEATGPDLQVDRNLVINLSVAWHPVFGGLEADVADMPVPVRAIYAAVEDAVCRGAIVIAAAGNVSRGPHSNQGGPMLPAAWERQIAPDEERCDALRREIDDDQGGKGDNDGGDGDTDDGDPGDLGRPTSPPFETKADESSYRPLVYAVGGIKANGARLPNARPSGRPPMVAIGDHGVVESHIPNQPTATLTGTSVATLVVSAAATAAWSYLPALDAADIMDLVYASGVALPISGGPDFCQGSACFSHRPKVHRIAVCDAVQAACSVSPNACAGSQPQCDVWPQAPSSNNIDFSGFDQSAVAFDAATLTQGYGTNPVCGAAQLFRHPNLAEDPEHPCPAMQFHGVDTVPWVHPQPGSHICPNCTVTTGPGGGSTLTTGPGGGFAKQGPEPKATLRIEITEDFEGTLSDPTITTASGIFSLSGYGLCLQRGSTCLVNNVPYPGHGPVTLSYKLTQNNVVRSVSSPAVILP